MLVSNLRRLTDRFQVGDGSLPHLLTTLFKSSQATSSVDLQSMISNVIFQQLPSECESKPWLCPGERSFLDILQDLDMECDHICKTVEFLLRLWRPTSSLDSLQTGGVSVTALKRRMLLTWDDLSSGSTMPSPFAFDYMIPYRSVLGVQHWHSHSSEVYARPFADFWNKFRRSFDKCSSIVDNGTAALAVLRVASRYLDILGEFRKCAGALESFSCGSVVDLCDMLEVMEFMDAFFETGALSMILEQRSCLALIAAGGDGYLDLLQLTLDAIVADLSVFYWEACMMAIFQMDSSRIDKFEKGNVEQLLDLNAVKLCMKARSLCSAACPRVMVGCRQYFSCVAEDEIIAICMFNCEVVDSNMRKYYSDYQTMETGNTPKSIEEAMEFYRKICCTAFNYSMVHDHHLDRLLDIITDIFYFQDETFAVGLIESLGDTDLSTAISPRESRRLVAYMDEYFDKKQPHLKDMLHWQRDDENKPMLVITKFSDIFGNVLVKQMHTEFIQLYKQRQQIYKLERQCVNDLKQRRNASKKDLEKNRMRLVESKQEYERNRSMELYGKCKALRTRVREFNLHAGKPLDIKQMLA